MSAASSQLISVTASLSIAIFVFCGVAFADNENTLEDFSEEDEEEESSSNEEHSKYKRHDQGGDRQRTNDHDDTGYSDRRRRIGEERRGPIVAAQKAKRAKQRRRRFAEKDKALRTKFEEERKNRWRNRSDYSQGELIANNYFESLKKDLLWKKGAPLLSVGARLSWMNEETDPGLVTGAEIDLNFLRDVVRMGVSAFAGVKTHLEHGDLVFMGNASIGVQYPWRFSPYIIARGGIGTLAHNHSGSDTYYMIRSLGLESGIDCRVTKFIVLSPSIGYVRYVMNNTSWNSFTAKISVGF